MPRRAFGEPHKPGIGVGESARKSVFDASPWRCYFAFTLERRVIQNMKIDGPCSIPSEVAEA